MKKSKSSKTVIREVYYPRAQWKKGFNILMDYWDFIPDEDKNRVDKELKKIGL